MTNGLDCKGFKPRLSSLLYTDSKTVFGRPSLAPCLPRSLSCSRWMGAGLGGAESHTSEDLGWSLRSTVLTPPLAGFIVALGDPEHLWISLKLPSRGVSICCPDCAQLRQQQMGPSGGGLPHFLPSVADMGDGTAWGWCFPQPTSSVGACFCLLYR